MIEIEDKLARVIVMFLGLTDSAFKALTTVDDLTVQEVIDALTQKLGESGG